MSNGKWIGWLDKDLQYLNNEAKKVWVKALGGYMKVDTNEEDLWNYVFTSLR